MVLSHPGPVLTLRAVVSVLCPGVLWKWPSDRPNTFLSRRHWKYGGRSGTLEPEMDGVQYRTMPFIEGTPLVQLIDPEKPWQPRTAAELVRCLALALAVLHERGLVHRDLKPGNIMIRTNGEPVLMDFGLARSFLE